VNNLLAVSSQMYYHHDIESRNHFMQNLLGLNFVGDLDEKVSTVPLVIPSRNKVVEANESQLKSFSLGVLKTCKDNLHDGNKILFQSVANKNKSVSTGV
jgi:hypothetical protein